MPDGFCPQLLVSPGIVKVPNPYSWILFHLQRKHKSEGNLAAADPPTKLFGFTVLGIELFTDVAWTLLGALLVNEL